MSNILAYDMALRTLPRPQTKNQHGLAVTWLLDAESNTSNTGVVNETEANAIVGFVKRHVDKKDPRSIAVITINSQQCLLIKNRLRDVIAQAMNSDRYASCWNDEPLIVRTTNDIQGEERDVVLISATYSPRATDGTQRFGVFERESPQERLNVMLSRARSHMHLFASFTGEDFVQPMTQGAMALYALVKGFETLTETDLRQEPPVSMVRLAKNLGLEVDHLGIVFGFKKVDTDFYKFGIVLNEESDSSADQDELCMQLRKIGWTIVEIDQTTLRGGLQNILACLKTLSIT